jgi:DNA-binding CsgD family transcriptional regulator
MVPVEGAVVVGAAVPSLVSCGLSPDADLVYRTLVTFGAGCAVELARGLGLPRRRVLDALDELAAWDAASLAPAARPETAVWRAHPPATVVPSLRHSRARPRARTGAAPMRGDHAPPELASLALGDGLRHLPTRAAARTRMAELVAMTRREHLAMNPEPAFEPQATQSAAPLDRVLLSRGVRMRVLGVQPTDLDPLAPHGRRPPEKMPDYRRMPAVPMKLIVVDRTVALFPVDPGDFGRGYLEVAQRPVVDALVSLFERNWDVASTPPAEPGLPPLSPRERALVALLAAGHTDETAARQIQVSSRSVTNILRVLMDRLGVQNRFQLGLTLGALYAVTPPRGPATTTTEGKENP